MTDQIRLLLVDDHTLFRSGLRVLMQRHPGFTVVGEAADGAEAVKRARQLRPDVVLMDLNMPGLSGLEALQLMRQESPDTVVLILTVSESRHDLLNALRAGAAGYLIKNIDADFLIQSIKRAVNGESLVSPSMMDALIDQARQDPAGQNAHLSLTPREREVLACLGQGESNKEIARRFDLAESTVKIHVQKIFKKLNLSSRAQAAVYAVANDLV